MNFSSQSTTYKPRHPETTDWEEVLVKKGIWQERHEITEAKARRREAQGRAEPSSPSLCERLEKLSVEELTRVEDECQEDDDEATWRKMRQKRLAELKREARKRRFGDVYPLSRPDFVRNVTEASKEYWIVVEMFKNGIPESQKCSELLRVVAKRHPQVKFFRIQSTDCVDKWPDDSVPCLFLYHKGVMQEQLIGLDFCGGFEKSTADTCERALATFCALSDALDEDTGTDSNNLPCRRGSDQEDPRNCEEELQGKVANSKTQTSVAKLPTTKTSSGAVLDNLDDEDW